MVEFGGWDMPVEYSGIVDEHLAVRTRAGLFDVSHMGEIEIAGRDALKAVQHITSNDASRLAIGQAHYSALPTPQGTFVDDVLTYKLTDEHFMLVVNASNIIKDFNWIATQIAGHRRRGGGEHQLALRAPRTAGAGGEGGAPDAHRRQSRRHQVLLVHDRRSRRRPRARFLAPATRARTASKCSCRRRRPSASGTRSFWPARLPASCPAGLGARDTLRLEAAMRLYGNDIDDTTTVLEADLGLDDRLEEGRVHRPRGAAQQKQEGVARKLVGFEVLDRAIARHGHDVYVDDRRPASSPAARRRRS